MCVFQSGQDIPPLVRLSLRTLQYLVIPLLSLSMVCVGSLHLDDCPAQKLLPVWHVIAGASGLIVPFLYLLFDNVNPRLSRRFPACSEALDNVVVFLLPVYVLFEVGWLITGSVWLFNTEGVEKPSECDHTIYIFSVVVIVNFWIHILTPIVFMVGLCCTRVFPYCAYCAYWNILKTATDNWTRRTRMTIATIGSIPLGVSMVITGAISTYTCGGGLTANNNATWIVEAPSLNQSQAAVQVDGGRQAQDYSKIPTWLIVAGSMVSAYYIYVYGSHSVGRFEMRLRMLYTTCMHQVVLVPVIYLLYDRYCKSEEGGPLIKRASIGVVIFFLLCGLAWSIVGFLWVFGAHESETCGAESFTYRFAFFTLIVMNVIMDIWVCFKMCVVLYWAFLSED